MNEKVSIIVPSYKRNAEMVSRAINSLLSQTYQNIEIVLVDDNAGEGLLQYRQQLEKMLENFDKSNIKYIQNSENLGGSLSRNVGIEAATGDYITFLDDDDRYLPKKIENQLNFMLINELEMSFTNLIVCDKNDKVVDFREYVKCKKFDTVSLMKYHLTRQIAGTNTFMYKADTIKKIGGFVKVNMGQEYYLMYNTIKSECKIGYAPLNDTILYREGQECISSGPNKIPGQKNLYKFKKENYNYLNLREKMFVRFRHHVVLAVANMRNKKLFKALWHVFIAGLCSPIDAIQEFFRFFKRRKKYQMEASK